MTKSEMIEKLVEQVDDMDLETVIELAKRAERDFYSKKTKAQVTEFYNDNFTKE